MASGSDLVYRVVLGWRFGPVPNRHQLHCNEDDCEKLKTNLDGYKFI